MIRIRRVTDPGTGAVKGQYWYDDQGFRVRRETTTEVDGEVRSLQLLYPSMYFSVETQKDQLGVPLPGTGFGVNNIFLNGVRVAAVLPNCEAQYYLTDQVDSVKVVTNDSGMVVTSHEYLPFGEDWITEGDTKNAPKYNSQELDKESGYYFYNARHYDPEIARFVTPDSIVPDQFSTQSWNRFSYCRNNPIIYRDPTGHAEVKMNEIRTGDVIGRTAGSASDAIMAKGQPFGHAALVTDAKTNKDGKLESITVIDLTQHNVANRLITNKGSWVIKENGELDKKSYDKNETISAYTKAFRVGTLEEGKKAVSRAESMIGKINYDYDSLFRGVIAKQDNALAHDNKMVCSEFVNWAYEGKLKVDSSGRRLWGNDNGTLSFGTIGDKSNNNNSLNLYTNLDSVIKEHTRATTPADIANAQKNLGDFKTNGSASLIYHDDKKN